MSVLHADDRRNPDYPGASRTVRISRIAEQVHPALTTSALRTAIKRGVLPATVIYGRFYVDPDEVRRIMLRNVGPSPNSEGPESSELSGPSTYTPQDQ